jgi:hypothetical protein
MRWSLSTRDLDLRTDGGAAACRPPAVVRLGAICRTAFSPHRGRAAGAGPRAMAPARCGMGGSAVDADGVTCALPGLPWRLHRARGRPRSAVDSGPGRRGAGPCRRPTRSAAGRRSTETTRTSRSWPSHRGPRVSTARHRRRSDSSAGADVEAMPLGRARCRGGVVRSGGSWSRWRRPCGWGRWPRGRCRRDARPARGAAASLRAPARRARGAPPLRSVFPRHVSSARRSRAPIAHLMPAPRAWWASTPAERTPGRTRTALRRAGHRVLGADDARIALTAALRQRAGGRPAATTDAAHGLRRPLMHAVLVPRGPRQGPCWPGAPRSALFVARGDMPAVLDVLAGRRSRRPPNRLASRRPT